MEPLHARYPFMEAARASVESTGVDLAALLQEDGPVVDRATDRVRSAIEEGTVGSRHRSDRVELLSYPVARVIVSILEEPGLVYRYARAEADAARERFVADIEDEDELRSVGRDRIELATLLSEFDLVESVDLTTSTYTDASDGGTVEPPDGSLVGVDVGVYLQLTDDLSEPAWELKRRSLAGGTVLISREELYALLREAIRERVAADLPLSVPASIESAVADRIETVRSLLADHDHEWDLDRVDPEAFPPCIEALLARADGEESLAAHSQFTLASFLITTGMETDDIVALVGDWGANDLERLAERIDTLRAGDSTPEYPPPSCETMVAYGDCVNKDALCERIAHPLDYYERRLAGEQPN